MARNDYTIEMWTVAGNHFAHCNCGWRYNSLYQAVVISTVRMHRKEHTNKGDAVEVI